MVYQQSQLVKPLFTIYIIIKVDSLERKPFVKAGIFPFAFIKANTRKDENDYVWSLKFNFPLDKNPYANRGPSFLATTAHSCRLYGDVYAMQH